MSSVFRKFDAIVMLTWSDWHKELRSNRYHYATRFAKHLPVIFVQPDLEEANYEFEETGVSNLTLLHVFNKYNQVQNQLLNKALFEKGIIHPVFWVYNIYFFDYLRQRFPTFIIYHATEEYLLSKTYRFNKGSLEYEKLINMTHITDLLISVSKGVEEGYTEVAKYTGNKIIITNGCDYKFYAPEFNGYEQGSNLKNVVFYQGNIFNKLNFSLLKNLAENMPEWQFWFCGRVQVESKDWSELLLYPNVKYLGLLSPEEIRKNAYKATVGIIPFVENDYLINRSLPLKAFEYLACGLPVVTVPVRALLPYPNAFYFAKTSKEFQEAIVFAAGVRNDQKSLNSRLQEAQKQDYDIKFENVVSKIQLNMNIKKNQEIKKNILIFYNPKYVRDQKALEQLMKFERLSYNIVHYWPLINEVECKIDLSHYHIIVFYHSLDCKELITNKMLLSLNLVETLKRYHGYKVLITLNEPENMEEINEIMKEFKFHAFFTSSKKSDVYSNTQSKTDHFEFDQFVDSKLHLLNQKELVKDRITYKFPSSYGFFSADHWN